MTDPALSRLYRSLVEAVAESAIFATDPAGVIGTWNQGVRVLFGYEPDEFIGESAEILLSCGDRRGGALQARLGMARREGSSSDAAWLVRNSGELTHVALNVKPILDESAALEGFAWMIRGLGPERLTNDSDAPGYTMLLSREDVIVEWTSAACTLYGWSSEEVIGKPVAEILGATGSEREIDRHLSQHREWSGIVARRRRDGSNVFVIVRRFLQDTGKLPETVVETNYDITPLLTDSADRELLEQLAGTRARLDAIVQQLPLGVVIASAPDGELILHNQEAEKLLGRPIESCTSPADPRYGALHENGTPLAASDHPLTRALNGEVTRKLDLLCCRGDGTSTHLLVNAGPVFDAAGKVVAAVATFEDFADRKHAESERERLLTELRRSNEDLSQFAHTVSHDLQEPLRILRSFSDLLLRRYSSALDTTGVEFIRIIADGAERMDELVQALLRYSRAGGAKLSLTTVEASEIVQDAIRNLQAQIEETGAKIECGELPAVRADPVQMTQVFQNLISNALKYRSPDAAPAIVITAHRTPGAWVFSVADNGMGIPSIHHRRIFSPLKRLHGPSIPGTGMGLAICRKIVQRHGGEVWVESELGAGATFRFTLPDRPGAPA
jgi:PAS domain S-box-containing protein